MFSIGNGAYEAEAGMTFGDWIESDYNVDGYQETEGSGVLDSTAEHFVALDGVGVRTVDEIVDEGLYTLEVNE